MSEQALEDQTILQLQKLGWSLVHFSKEHGDQEMEDNFFALLQKLNQDALTTASGFQPLDDAEKQRILATISTLTEVTATQTLQNGGIELPRTDGTRVALRLIDFQNWGANTFQVSRQVWDTSNRRSRYDVTLLINGIPVIQEELKRPGISVEAAFEQTLKYKNKAYSGLFKFLQLFIISNGVVTRYYVSNSPNLLSMQHTFQWADEKNKRLGKLEDFTNVFLRPNFIVPFLKKRIRQRGTGANTMNIVARSYQHYAVEAALDRIRTAYSYTQLTPEVRRARNGYIHHATGSGKTFTSYMLAQETVMSTEADRVVFVVDRSDLDTQTVEQYNAFQPGSVDETDDSRALLQRLQDPTVTLIVTTIQKLNHLIKKNRLSDFTKQQKTVFITDEAHRSNTGEMHTNIERSFPNAVFIGFTGTPIYEQNRGGNNFLTADFYGKCVHRYLMQNAIADDNVLKFHAEWMSTVAPKEEGLDEEVEGINREEVLLHPDRIKHNVDDILKHHAVRTHKGEFNAILATSSVKMLAAYWNEFQSRNLDGYNVAAIFTVSEEEHSESLHDLVYADFKDKYNASWLDATPDPQKAWKKEVANKLKDGSLDLVIVVDMMLTGFDSPRINTLYIDKALKHHNLIQAMSRTNRLNGPHKKQGNIVFYQGTQKTVDDAVALFSHDMPTDNVFAKPYKEMLAQFNSYADELKGLYPTPDDLLQERSEKKIKHAVNLIAGLATTLSTLKRYIQFDKTALHLTDLEEAGYRSAMLNLRDYKDDPDLVSVLNDLEFQFTKIDEALIDVDYISELLKTNTDSEEEFKEDTNRIIARIEAAKPPVSPKSLHIRDFLLHIQGRYTTAIDLEQEFNTYTDEKAAADLAVLAKDFGLGSDILGSIVEEYELAEDENELAALVSRALVGSSSVKGLTARTTAKKHLTQRLINFHERYNLGT